MESIKIPYTFSNGKADILMEIYNEKDPIPIKFLKLRYNKGRYYSFIRDIERLNNFILHNYPDYFPLFRVTLGKDRVSGQEVKVIEKSAKVEVQDGGDLVILSLLDT